MNEAMNDTSPLHMYIVIEVPSILLGSAYLWCKGQKDHNQLGEPGKTLGTSQAQDVNPIARVDSSRFRLNRRLQESLTVSFRVTTSAKLPVTTKNGIAKELCKTKNSSCPVAMYIIHQLIHFGDEP